MQTLEASRVFEHLESKGLKPNATSYSLLADARLINRDPKSALSLVADMVTAYSLSLACLGALCFFKCFFRTSDVLLY